MLESSPLLLVINSILMILGVLLAYWLGRRQWPHFDGEAEQMADIATPFLRKFQGELAHWNLPVDAEAIEFLRHRIEHAQNSGVLRRYDILPANMSAASRGAGLAFAAIVRAEARKAEVSKVSVGFLDGILDFLCPGFFPFC